jgi:hypothetical protein
MAANRPSQTSARASGVTSITVAEVEGMEHPRESQRLRSFVAGPAMMAEEAVLILSNGSTAEEERCMS